MGIGRRKFLEISAAFLAGASFDPLRATVTSNDTYLNRKLGVLFKKPQGWSFIHISDFGQLRDKQIWGDVWGENRDDILEYVEEPVMVCTKYGSKRSSLKGTFSPTIQLFLAPRSEVEDLEFESIEELLEMSAIGTSTLLREFHTVKRYLPYILNNSIIYERDSEYLFEHADIEGPLKVEMKLLAIEHHNCYYFFNCHHCFAQSQTALPEFSEFKESLHLI